MGHGEIVTGEFFFFFFFFMISVVDDHIDHHIHMYYPKLTRSSIELAFCPSPAPARAWRVKSLNHHPLMNQSRIWFVYLFSAARKKKKKKKNRNETKRVNDTPTEKNLTKESQSDIPFG